jgi:hypothetical protein
VHPGFAIIPKAVYALVCNSEAGNANPSFVLAPYPTSRFGLSAVCIVPV